MLEQKQASPPRARPALVLTALLLLGGCATFSLDGGFDAVTQGVQERGITQETRWLRSDEDRASARAAIAQLLAEPLSPDAAVQIALLNNRALQGAYAQLGVAEADLVQAGRLRNPGFSFARLQRGDALEIERAVLIDIMSLVTMPMRTAVERRRFQLTQTRITGDVLQVAADTRRAWHRAVAARESAKYAEQVKEAAEASAELARRMAVAGNFSKLDQAREQAFYAEATAQLARARLTAVNERERLTQLMGLWGNDIQFRLPERLPDLPKSPRTVADLEAQALKTRLDVRGTMQEAEGIAATFDLTRTTGFVDLLELGYQRNSETREPHQTGFELEARLPLFDWGTARNTRAQHAYMQAVHRAADTAVRARSEVRAAFHAYRTAFDLARHYRDEIVPLRKTISEENVLRYNGMLISVFELLADARQQIASVNAYLDALRDFWIADVSLELALTGRSPGPATPMTAGAPPAAEATGRH